jgi:prevent-host-death family protein
MAMMRVGVAELKDNLSRYLRAVEAGTEVEVTDHSRAIARIVPVSASEAIRVRPALRPFATIRNRRYAPLNSSVDSLALLREERQERGSR